MNKKELFIGLFLGLATCMLGMFLFITFGTDFKFIEGVQSLKAQGNLGKLVTIGAVLDLVLFGILLKFDREIMARGVVLAAIAIAIYTFFV